MAAQLFKLFDKDGSGQVTMSELKEQLDQLNVGLSIDEIGALVRCVCTTSAWVSSSSNRLYYTPKAYPFPRSKHLC